MFRKRQKVVYPRHGAGKIIDKYTVESDGKKQEYYKVKFYDSPITISIPQKKAEELGLREPCSKTKIKRELRKLGNKVKVTKSLMKKLDETAKEKLLSGKFSDAIKLVNILKSIAEKKEKENKNFSYTASQRLENVLNFIKSETEMVLGKRETEKYELV